MTTKQIKRLLQKEYNIFKKESIRLIKKERTDLSWDPEELLFWLEAESDFSNTIREQWYLRWLQVAIDILSSNQDK